MKWIDLKIPHVPEIERILGELSNARNPRWGVFGLWRVAQIQSEVEMARGRGLLNEQGQLVAFLFARAIGPDWEITLVAVDPRWQRRGLACGLIQELLRKLEPEQNLFLEVHEKNQPACQLYDKLGFIQTGKRLRYYPDQGAALIYCFTR